MFDALVAGAGHVGVQIVQPVGKQRMVEHGFAGVKDDRPAAGRDQPPEPPAGKEQGRHHQDGNDEDAGQPIRLGDIDPEAGQDGPTERGAAGLRVQSAHQASSVAPPQTPSERSGIGRWHSVSMIGHMTKARPAAQARGASERSASRR